MGKPTPIIIIAIAFIAGIFTCKIAIDYIHIDTIYLLALAIVWFIGMLGFNKMRMPNIFELSTTLFCFFTGALLFLIRFNEVKDGINMNNQYIRGEIIKTPIKSAHSWAVDLKTDNGTKIKAYLHPYCQPRTGNIIELQPSYGLQSTCPLYDSDSTYKDYRNYLFYSGFSATCYAGKEQWRLTNEESNNIYTRIHSLQESMIKQYKEAGFEGNEGAVITAMTTGNKASLSKQTKEKYSHAGVSHILALSGFHLTLLYTMLEWLLFAYIAPRRWRIITQCLSIIMIIAFTIIAGAPASLVRATIICTLMSVTSIFQNDNSSMNSLSLAAILMLAYNPLMLFDVGFQLSFASMIGLCTVCRPMSNLLTIKNRLLNNVWSLTCCTITCSLFTFPLITYYFGYFPLTSIFTNVIITFIAYVLLIFSVLWWIMYFIPTIQEIIGTCMNFTASLMNDITDWISSMKWAICEFRLNLLGVIMCYLLLVSVILLVSRITKKNILNESDM